MSLRKQSMSFVKRFFQTYLEDRDFEAALAMLSHEISWFGPDKHDVCYDYQRALSLLSTESNASRCNYVISDYWSHAIIVDTGSCHVMGTMRVSETTDNAIPDTMDCRFSMLCRLEDGKLRLLHCHYSVANPTQLGVGCDNKSLAEHYNSRLEAALVERTRLLKEKSESIKALISNITGGVVMSEVDAPYSITYFNKGFCELTGYDADDIATLLHNSMPELVAPEYRDYTVKSFTSQVDAYNRFELEYPILCRDGERRWVLEKGTIVSHLDGSRQAQSILTDITSHKRLENDLRQQNQALTQGKRQLFEANISCNTVIVTDPRLATDITMPQFESYSDLASYLTAMLVHPDNRENVELFFSAQRAADAMSHGEIQRSIQFQLVGSNGISRWTQADITSVLDALSGDLKLRCYLQDINDDKLRLDSIENKQKLYELMIAQSSVVYEISLSRDTAISGHENWAQLYGIESTPVYSEMISALAHKSVHPDDASDFLRVMRLQSALSAFADGRRDLYCEFRRARAGGEYQWVSCTMLMFTHDDSGEVRALCYVQDIHETKLQQLELLYNAEHDQLTGLLNKAKVAQAVDSYLLGEGKNGKHAFFIFDLDHFKAINDSLGHAFGDVVLSRISAKAAELFREYDLLGRVGGDEFVVFMKNISNVHIVESKARELGERLHDVYNRNGVPFPVSVSVGVALYPMHGLDYHELYTHSDIALYTAKESGRNRSMIYNSALVSAPERTTQPDNDELVEPHAFERNISEFIFRILYDTPNKKSAIESVLELIGKQYGVSRAYIYEEDANGQSICNTFEWCAEGVASQLAQQQSLDYRQLGEYPLNFNEAGIYYLPNLDNATAQELRVFEPQGIVSVLQFAIMRSENHYGFVGFDFCNSNTNLAKSDIAVLKTVSNMLGVFLTEMRALDTSEKMQRVAFSVIDALDSYAYVIDPTNYRLRLINRKTLTVSPTTIVGDYCYRSFMNRDTPCDSCPMSLLGNEADEHATVDVVNSYLGKHTRATATWLDWTDGSRSCLMHCVEL